MTGIRIIRPPECVTCGHRLPVTRTGRNFNRNWTQAIAHELKRQGWHGDRQCFDCGEKTRVERATLNLQRKGLI